MDRSYELAGNGPGERARVQQNHEKYRQMSRTSGATSKTSTGAGRVGRPTTTSGFTCSRTVRMLASAALVVLAASQAAATPPGRDGRPQIGGHPSACVRSRPLPDRRPDAAQPRAPRRSTGRLARRRHREPWRVVPSYQPAPGIIRRRRRWRLRMQSGSFYCQVHDRGYASRPSSWNHPRRRRTGCIGGRASFLVETAACGSSPGSEWARRATAGFAERRGFGRAPGDVPSGSPPSSRAATSRRDRGTDARTSTLVSSTRRCSASPALGRR